MPLAPSLFVLVVVVMIAAACPHEHRIIAIIVIEDGHALCKALVVIGRGQHRNAPL